MAQNKVANRLLVGGIVAAFLYLLNFGVTSNSLWTLLVIIGGYCSPIAILVGLSIKILIAIEQIVMVIKKLRN